jgi:hypothetical protein
VTKTVEYFYDMFNRWTMRDHDVEGDTGSLTHEIEQYMHDGQETLVQGVPNAGAWRAYMRGPVQDMVIFEARDELRATLGDHLNTIRDVVDASGNLDTT